MPRATRLRIDDGAADLGILGQQGVLVDRPASGAVGLGAWGHVDRA